MQEEISRLPVEVVRNFMVDVFKAQGVSSEDALICAEVLITSDLRGIESHGVGRLAYYYARIQAGIQFPAHQMEIIKETETTALVDGHHGMGHPTAYRSMQMAIDKAKQYGLGAVAVRNATHFGIAGYYPLMAAKQGLMGFAFTNARPSISPTFSTEPMLGTNPIAFAAPSDGEFPFCFDGATSIAQRGKIEVADRAEKPVPEGWVIDAEGQPMTHAPDILKAIPKFQASLLPLGGAGEDFAGYKGYDLAVIVEILSASLSGGPFMKDLLGFNADGSRRPHMLGHFFLAIDVQHFLPLEVSRKITGDIMRALQGAKKAPGADRIYVAGEKEYEKEKVVRELGIPVNTNLLKTLRRLRDALSVTGYENYF
ncbi:MAG: Ldh family oxidoreductase [Anaerolineae bacterium]|nr:Ldh family oxidoreductase [Anaerolineae bacterium]